MNRSGIWAACVVLVLLVGVGVLAGGAGQAKDDQDENAVAKCSEATLHGQYLVAHNGVVVEVTDPQFRVKGPFATAGYEVYDGNGKVKGVYSFNFNGEVFHNERFSGTYTVKADCTGTNTFISDGVPYKADLFIAPDGSKFTLVQTNPSEWVTSGFELQGTAKRIED